MSQPEHPTHGQLCIHCNFLQSGQRLKQELFCTRQYFQRGPNFVQKPYVLCNKFLMIINTSIFYSKLVVHIHDSKNKQRSEIFFQTNYRIPLELWEIGIRVGNG